MFMIAHASEFEVASVRARLRWAEAVDALLASGETDTAATTALAQARAELCDLRTDLSHDDLHRLADVVRSHRAASRASAQAVTR
jgi:hypothetical protein